jgi:hypothetical protein
MEKVGKLYFWWKYITNKKFRQDMEVESYKVSILYGQTLNCAALHLSSNYYLGITYNQAIALLA